LGGDLSYISFKHAAQHETTKKKNEGGGGGRTEGVGVLETTKDGGAGRGKKRGENGGG